MTTTEVAALAEAQPGALMLRRADVRGIIQKTKQRARVARNEAVDPYDYAFHRARYEVAEALLAELDEKLPVFANPAAAPAHLLASGGA